MKEGIEKFRVDTLDLVKKNYSLNINGVLQTKIPSLDFYFSDKPTEFNAIIYEPSLCIILQGSKAVGFGDEMYSYGTNEYLLSSTHVPAKVRIQEASEKILMYLFVLNLSLKISMMLLKILSQQNLHFLQKQKKVYFLMK